MKKYIDVAVFKEHIKLDGMDALEAGLKAWIDNQPAADVFDYDSTIYGYNLKDLLTFAHVCRMQGITEENLKDFCLNFSAATDAAFQMTLQKISDDMGKEIVKCIERTLT